MKSENKTIFLKIKFISEILLTDNNVIRLSVKQKLN